MCSRHLSLLSIQQEISFFQETLPKACFGSYPLPATVPYRLGEADQGSDQENQNVKHPSQWFIQNDYDPKCANNFYCNQ